MSKTAFRVLLQVPHKSYW